VSGGEDVKIDPASVLQTAQGVSAALGQAAEPGPVPYATGVSPIDAAAAAASSEVIGLVSAASADLAPRGGEVMGATETAVSGLQTADGKNATDLGAVGEQAQAQSVQQAASAATGAATQGGPAGALSGALGPLEEAASAAASPLQQLASTGAGPLQQVASAATGPLQEVASSATSGAGSSAATGAPTAQQGQADSGAGEPTSSGSGTAAV
jgi:hypothetical protein